MFGNWDGCLTTIDDIWNNVAEYRQDCMVASRAMSIGVQVVPASLTLCPSLRERAQYSAQTIVMEHLSIRDENRSAARDRGCGSGARIPLSLARRKARGHAAALRSSVSRSVSLSEASRV